MERRREYLDKLETSRTRLLNQFNIAIFNCDLARASLPSLNPFDLFLVTYHEFRRRHGRLVRGLATLGFGAWLLVAAIMILDMSRIASLGRVSLPLLGFVPLYLPLIFLVFVIAYVVPLSLWFWSLYQRIRLTVFSDYIKKIALRELRLVSDYYSLIQRVPEFRSDEARLKDAIAETDAYAKTIAAPKFLRNLTLGSLSSALGLLGLASSLFRDTSIYLPVLGEITSNTMRGIGNWVFSTVMLPLEFLVFLIVMPITRGIIGTQRYYKANLVTLRQDLRRLMFEEMSELSPSGAGSLALIPRLEDELNDVLENSSPSPK